MIAELDTLERPATDRTAGVPPYSEDPGTCVRARLTADPDVHKLPVDALELFLMREFLDVEECAAVIARIDADKRPSTLMGAERDPEYRTSETSCFEKSTGFLTRIENRLDTLLGIDARYGERVQGQRYAVGQQFKPHHDFFHTNQPYWPRQQRSGGQRTWTAMVFLNVPEAGGKTFFPNIGLRVTPRLGNLLVWNNLNLDGEPNHASLHQGMPVEGGVKYVLTKWYRERPFDGARGGFRPPAVHPETAGAGPHASE